jgi:hypothetical protein
MLLVPLLLIVLAAPASAWGGHTHEVMTREALALVHDAGCDTYLPYEGDIVRSSTLPDLWRACDDPRGDITYHLSYPSGYGKAPKAAAYWYDLLVEDLSCRRYDEAALDAGVMSHYVGDALCALHTGPYVAAHPEIETWVNEMIASFEHERPEIAYIEDVEQAVTERSREMHGLYEETVCLGAKQRWDLLEPIVSTQLDAYLALLTSLLYSAYQDASTPVGEERPGMPLKTMIGVTLLIIAGAAMLRVRHRGSGRGE